MINSTSTIEKIELTKRGSGKQGFWMLKIFKSGRPLPVVYTRKSRSQIMNIKHEYEKGYR